MARRRILGARAALAATAALGLLLGACGSGRPGQDAAGSGGGPPAAPRAMEAEAYPYDATKPQAFILGARGLIPLAEGSPESGSAGIGVGKRDSSGSGDGGRILLSAEAAQGEAARKEATSGRLSAALGDWGIAILEGSPEGGRFRLVQRPETALVGLEPGGLWPSADGTILQLFRNPFTESGIDPGEEDSTAATGDGTGMGGLGARRLFIITEGGLSPIEPEWLPTAGGENAARAELFALFPDPLGSGWLAQLRSEGAGPGSATSQYLEIPKLRGPGRPIERGTFEARLAPRRLAEAPEELQRAAAAWGKAALIIRERDAAGGERFWTQGAPEEAQALEAWRSERGLLAASAEGRLLWATAGGLREYQAAAALPGTRFGSLSSMPAGTGLLAVLAWEAENGERGLVTLPIR